MPDVDMDTSEPPGGPEVELTPFDEQLTEENEYSDSYDSEDYDHREIDYPEVTQLSNAMQEEGSTDDSFRSEESSGFDPYDETDWRQYRDVA